jgi:hypothetical protein
MKQRIILTAGLMVLWVLSSCKSGSSDSNPSSSVTSPSASTGNTAGSLSQAPVGGLAGKIIAARNTDATLLRNYSWNCRTELLEDGKIKDIRIDLVVPGPKGGWQQSVINDESAPLPHGFIRRHIAQDERERLEKYLNGLHALVNQYTLPAAGRIARFVGQAEISAPDANGLLKLSGASVVMPGDAFNLWVEGVKCRTRKIQATSSYEQDTVELYASFTTLKSGLTHLQYAEVDVPAKKLKLYVHNFDYTAVN